MRMISLAACAGLTLTLVTGASAQTVEQDGPQDEYSVATERAQDLFVKYHMAMDADMACRQVQFSAEDRLAMDRAAAQEMVAVSPQVSLGAGRLLNLRREADDGFSHVYSREGCDGQKVKKLVAFYDERLANIRPAPAAPLPADAAPVPAADAQPMAATPAGRTGKPRPGSRRRPLTVRSQAIAMTPDEGDPYAVFTFDPSPHRVDTQDRRQFRNALGLYPTGITIVTALADDGERIGLTVNSFTSISLHPPLVLFAVALRARSAPVFQKGARCAVNILDAAQEDLSVHFASPHPDRFAGIAFDQGMGGVPLLKACSAWLEAFVQDIHPCGDHLLIVGRVDRFAYRETDDPLVYYRGQYSRLGVKR